MGRNPVKSVEKGAKNMKRTDITNIFPDATDEQVKALMTINGADINNAKKGVEDLQTKLTEAAATIETLQNDMTGFEEAKEKAKKFETELTELKTANTIREVREKVSRDTGVPVALLTGVTAEDCMAQANGILEYAKPSAYPSVADGGEAGGIDAPTPREQFTEWFNQF